MFALLELLREILGEIRNLRSDIEETNDILKDICHMVDTIEKEYQ